jgi:hypothetical protein
MIIKMIMSNRTQIKSMEGVEKVETSESSHHKVLQKRI